MPKIKKELGCCSLLFMVGLMISMLVPSILGISILFPQPAKVNAAETDTRQLADINYMQEMNKYICENSAVGDSRIVRDIRDNNTYTIGKLADNNCWMTQNLRLTRESIARKSPSNPDGLLTPEYSDIATNYNLPASALWNDTDNSVSHVYYDNNITNGAYYSWNAATAGTDSDKASICAKGWQLPTGDTDSELHRLYLLYPGRNPAGFSQIDGVNGHWLGADSMSAGGAFFPAAGYVNAIDNDLAQVGDFGFYWSNTAYGDIYAYLLTFTNNQILPTYNHLQYSGYSVRCIADPTNTEIVTIPVPPTATVAAVVSKIISIDAASGMDEVADHTLITSGTITATVNTNASSHSILLSAENPNLTSENIINNSIIPASSTVIPETNAWGILNSDGQTYSAVTTKPTEFYSTSGANPSGGLGIQHIFTVGISIAQSLPADTYSTEVTITAVAN